MFGKKFFNSFDGKIFFCLCLWNIVLNAILVLSFHYFDTSLDKIVLGAILGIEIIVLIIFAYMERSNSKKQFIEEIKDVIKEQIEINIKQEMQSNISEGNKKTLDDFLERMKMEGQNVVFLRTLSDAICKNGEWNPENLKKLLDAINSIAVKKNKSIFQKIKDAFK